MRNVLVLVALAAVILVSMWLFLGGPSPAVAPHAAGRQDQAHATRQDPSPARSGSDVGERTRRLRERAGEQTALRERITEALHAREVAAAQARRVAADEGAAAPARPRKSDDTGVADETPPATAMIDRTGNHAYLTRVINQELIPLADECYDLARAQQPALAGMLVLDVEILGDEEVGGVVDSVEPGATNELVDPALLECVRESLLATALPPPEQGGRDAISLSMRFSPDDEE
jgi:hypothetical protein